MEHLKLSISSVKAYKKAFTTDGSSIDNIGMLDITFNVASTTLTGADQLVCISAQLNPSGSGSDGLNVDLTPHFQVISVNPSSASAAAPAQKEIFWYDRPTNDKSLSRIAYFSGQFATHPGMKLSLSLGNCYFGGMVAASNLIKVELDEPAATIAITNAIKNAI